MAENGEFFSMEQRCEWGRIINKASVGIGEREREIGENPLNAKFHVRVLLQNKGGGGSVEEVSRSAGILSSGRQQQTKRK